MITGVPNALVVFPIAWKGSFANMKSLSRKIQLLACGIVLLQFGGCVAAGLADVFFLLGPFLL